MNCILFIQFVLLESQNIISQNNEESFNDWRNCEINWGCLPCKHCGESREVLQNAIFSSHKTDLFSAVRKTTFVVKYRCPFIFSIFIFSNEYIFFCRIYENQNQKLIVFLSNREIKSFLKWDRLFLLYQREKTLDWFSNPQEKLLRPW